MWILLKCFVILQTPHFFEHIGYFITDVLTLAKMFIQNVSASWSYFKVHRFLHFIQLHLLIGQVFLPWGFLHTIFFPLIFTVSLKGLNMSPSTVASPSNKDTVIVPSYPETRRYGLEILAHLLSDPYRPPSPTIKLLLGKSTLS